MKRIRFIVVSTNDDYDTKSVSSEHRLHHRLATITARRKGQQYVRSVLWSAAQTKCADPPPLLDLRNPNPVDTVGRHSSAGVTNPQVTTISSRYPFNNASVTTVLAYPSKSDACATITTLKLTNIDAFERFYFFYKD